MPVLLFDSYASGGGSSTRVALVSAIRSLPTPEGTGFPLGNKLGTSWEQDEPVGEITDGLGYKARRNRKLKKKAPLLDEVFRRVELCWRGTWAG